MEEQGKGLSLNDMLFVALVRDFESMAMVGFGKLVDPVSQKAEKNLDRAKVAIDMLGMLEEKTNGNLNDTEAALLRQALTNLRLNYVDEVEKERAGQKAGGEEQPGDNAAATGSGAESGKTDGAAGGAESQPEEKAGGAAGAGGRRKSRGKATGGRKRPRRRVPEGGKDGGDE